MTTAVAAPALSEAAAAPLDMQRRRGDYGFDGSVPPLIALAAAGLGLTRAALAAARGTNAPGSSRGAQ